MNALGIVHGGVYCALLDVAIGHAVAFCTVPGHTRLSTTLALSTTFLRSATGGMLTATGRLHGVDGRVATGTGEVRDGNGTVCATAQASFLYFPGSEQPQGVPRHQLQLQPRPQVRRGSGFSRD
jgi:uncharacterized protein (TIGR00369 family)